LKKFDIDVTGRLCLEVEAEHQEMAEAMIEAAIYEKDGEKYGLTKEQVIALRELEDPEVQDVQEVPET